MQTRMIAPQQVQAYRGPVQLRGGVARPQPGQLDSFVPSRSEGQSVLGRVAVSAGIGAYGFMAASAALPQVAASLSGPWGAVGAHLALAGVGGAIGWATSSKDSAGEPTSTGRRLLGATIGACAAGAATVSGAAPAVSRLVLGAVGGALFGLVNRD